MASNACAQFFPFPTKKASLKHGLRRSSAGLKISKVKQSFGHRIFLLSPAYAGGERARMILRQQAQFPLARKLRGKTGAPLADVFTFLSGLYFRGKIAYANAFARAPRGTSGVFVITPTRGLIDAQTRIRLDDLREFAEVDIHENDPRYRLPIDRDARHLAKKLSARSEVVLLGSIATGKYVDVLLANFGQRLRFPAEFVGRGDMSRGGLMLRCAADLQELSYLPVAGAIVNGKRPPKLAPRRYATATRAYLPSAAPKARSHGSLRAPPQEFNGAKAKR